MDERSLADGVVVLTRPRAGDIDAIVAHCQDPAIAEWVTIPVPYGRADAEFYLADIVAAGWAERSPVWAVRRAADGPMIGSIGLHDSGFGAAEIGFWLAPGERGSGLMSRAVGLVCAFGFEELELARIGWLAYVGNRASAAVVRRNGFRFEGTQRLGAVQRGVRRDCWLGGRLVTDAPGPAAGWPSDT
ncbi:GNAT family N-acetyltransferase [Nocardia sp. NPDC050697]|uniref:GNAT family N-acetyltransferase n=1 Tax=Nocardia sp. NPDC050697 TaxID=3155158 RepID=UPI003406F37F